MLVQRMSSYRNSYLSSWGEHNSGIDRSLLINPIQGSIPGPLKSRTGSEYRPLGQWLWDVNFLDTADLRLHRHKYMMRLWDLPWNQCGKSEKYHYSGEFKTLDRGIPKKIRHIFSKSSAVA